MKNLIFLSIISLFVACQSKPEQKTENIDTTATTTKVEVPALDEALTFGFSNESGSQILAFEENLNLKLYTQTIDNQGFIASISFLKEQKGNESGVNLTSQNFGNCSGQIFEIKDNKKVNKDLTTVLFNETFIQNHSYLPVKSLEKPQNIDAKTKSAIAADKKRAVKDGWKIADLGDNQYAYIVVFEPKKDSVLASLVIGNEAFIYRDYPAKYDEGSTWRVDDGGEFSSEAIKILAAFRNKNGDLELVTEWVGAEGANIEFVKSNKNSFETVKEASRYWGAY
jgi:hypothetical protein